MIVSLVSAALALITVVETSGIASANGDIRGALPNATYTTNGLTCSIPEGTPSNVGAIVQVVIKSSQFLSKTNGLPYVFAGYSYMTQGTEQIGSTTIPLPNRLELGFYTNGSSTICATNPKSWLNSIDVQVPLLSGTYSVVNETVHLLSGGPK